MLPSRFSILDKNKILTTGITRENPELHTASWFSWFAPNIKQQDDILDWTHLFISLNKNSPTG